MNSRRTMRAPGRAAGNRLVNGRRPPAGPPRRPPPAASSCCSLAAATGPPPTSTTRRPARFRNSGSNIEKRPGKRMPSGPFGFWSLRSFELECVDSTCDQSAGSEARRSPTTAATCAHRRPDHGDLVLPEPDALSQAFQWFAATLGMPWDLAAFQPAHPGALRRRVRFCRPGPGGAAAAGRRAEPLRPRLRGRSRARAFRRHRDDPRRQSHNRRAPSSCTRWRSRSARSRSRAGIGDAEGERLAQRAAADGDARPCRRPSRQGPAEIHITYGGILNDKLRGFYLSTENVGPASCGDAVRSDRRAPRVSRASTSRPSRPRSTSR